MTCPHLVRRRTAALAVIGLCLSASACGTDDDGVDVSSGLAIVCGPLHPDRPTTLGIGMVTAVPFGTRLRVFPVEFEGTLAIRDLRTVLVPTTVGADGTTYSIGVTEDDPSKLKGAIAVPSEGIELRGPVKELQVVASFRATDRTRLTHTLLRYSVLGGPVETAEDTGTEVALQPRCH